LPSSAWLRHPVGTARRIGHAGGGRPRAADVARRGPGGRPAVDFELGGYTAEGGTPTDAAPRQSRAWCDAPVT
jgi:hypothetical protein